MKVSRQPEVSALLRIFAGTCVLLWLAGIPFCGIDRVCNCARDDGDCAAHASPVHDEHAAASPHQQEHSQDAERHHDAEVCQDATASDHHDGTTPERGTDKNSCKRCCSTIQALIPTMTPVVIPKTVSQPVLNISLLCATRQHVFAAPPSETLRRAKPRDWVFTPQVCLGAAHRSLAPPSLA